MELRLIERSQWQTVAFGIRVVGQDIDKDTHVFVGLRRVPDGERRSVLRQE